MRRGGAKRRVRAVAIAALTLTAIVSLTPVSRRRGNVPAQAWASPDATSVSGAIEFFERRLSADPGNTVFMSGLAGRYMQRFQLTADPADVARAEALSRALLGERWDPTAGRARLAAVLLARHAFADALDLAEEAVVLAPLDPGAWALLFDAAFASGHYERASEALTRLEPGSVTRRLKSSFWLQARGRLDSAEGELRAACRRIATWSIPEQEAFCRTELAHIERSRGDAREAGALYSRALEVVPGYRAAVEGLADLAYAANDRQKAEALYRGIAVDAHPDLYLRLSELRRARGDSAGASRWEREFLRVATVPGAEPLYGRWLALQWAERPETRDAAIAVARRDVARRPAVESWDALAWVHYRRGEAAEALAASDRAVAWGAPSPTIEYHRARILEALCRRAEAQPWLVRATADPRLLDPGARIDLGRR